MEDEDLQLVLIPWPVMGHVQIVEFANLIIHRQDLLPPGKTLSITVLLMKLPDYIDTVASSFTESLSAASFTGAAARVNFLHLPPTTPSPEWSSRTRGYFIHNLVLSQKPNVADFLRRTPNIVALVVDMLCTSMIAVGDELRVPSYIFFTSPASFLGAMLHCQTLHDEKNENIADLTNSNTGLELPPFSTPVPPKVLSLVLVDKQQWLDRFLHYARDYRKAKGVIINTFTDLESYTLNSFSHSASYGGGVVPPVYPVGPILNHGQSVNQSSLEILQWLDNQPSKSVVFVCFGSQGSLNEEQVKELATALERSQIRFLWSLRRQSSNSDRARFPTEYANYGGVLPEGFLERTAGTGKVVGWAPQLEVLSHEAVGGFVSHCGWNSVLESLWCGVPIATWPLHSEQQMNAFQLVRELGLAVEITLSYYERNIDGAVVTAVTAPEIERGIREVMERESEVRRRVEEMKEKSRKSVVEGGSSYLGLERFVLEIIHQNETKKAK
ncbi:UDP-glucuronosyl and UDP-glucosyl transferase [Handroanthus impetiginosus]|uniref:Glycosyltransferase n=1 Tax=Handroanthus impetiginosus TaxID=429701 RepID=A0A2G9GHX7_9LAMI|nr:UDP-glucuronosyl and UDP-glucosyl transferase [Handroanthus impetiginosus]